MVMTTESTKRARKNPTATRAAGGIPLGKPERATKSDAERLAAIEAKAEKLRARIARKAARRSEDFRLIEKALGLLRKVSRAHATIDWDNDSGVMGVGDAIELLQRIGEAVSKADLASAQAADRAAGSAP